MKIINCPDCNSEMEKDSDYPLLQRMLFKCKKCKKVMYVTYNVLDPEKYPEILYGDDE